jgi:hypothetical protein
MNYGLKIAKDGKNVLTASDDNLTYSSKFRTLKVWKSGTVINTTDANGDFTSEVVHSLGFIPAFTAFRKNGTTQVTFVDGLIPGASNDDADWDSSEIFITGEAIEVGSSKNCGVRFPEVAVPKDAVIKSAYITFKAFTSQTDDTCKARIYAEANANPGAFVSREDTVNKTLTGASVQWTLPDMEANAPYDTPNIASVVQEVVNLANWSSGNPMLFMLKNDGSTSAIFKNFFSWDGSYIPGYFEPQLTIYFEEAADFPNVYAPNPNNPNPDVPDFYNSIVYADKQKIYFRMDNASPSTTYEFKYYVFADLIDNSGGTAPPGTKNTGLKMTPLPKDIRDAQLFEQSFTSRLRTLKIDPALVGTKVISLPALTTGEQTVSFDITHGFGYPPYFMAFYNSDITNPTWHLEIPGYYLDGLDNVAFKVYHWCDPVKIRISAWRFRHPLGSNLAAEKITVKYYIFRENLALL